MLGIGATEASGVKVGPDRYGPIFDPTNGDRAMDPESMPWRGLPGAPLPDIAARAV